MTQSSETPGSREDGIRPQMKGAASWSSVSKEIDTYGEFSATSGESKAVSESSSGGLHKVFSALCSCGQVARSGSAFDHGESVRVTSNVERAQAVTELRYARGAGKNGASLPVSGGKRTLPVGSKTVDEDDVHFIAECLTNLLLFHEFDSAQQIDMIVSGMYERPIPAGEILIQEGEAGFGIDEMYIVKSGEFEVLQRRKGVNLRVNMKHRGDSFGELSLMYNSPRCATVAATQDSLVWVLDRETFRRYIQIFEEKKQGPQDQEPTIELFLNQVPILAHLSRDEKLEFLEHVEEVEFQKGDIVVREGEEGKSFYIIKSGEASVYQCYGMNKEDSQTDEVHGTKKRKQRRINKLFEADFFGEGALLTSSLRKATVVSDTALVCYTINKDVFVKLLAPHCEMMLKEKSPYAVGTRLMKIASLGGPSRQSAMVHIKRKRYSKSQKKWIWEMVRAVGHLDEVWELNRSSDPYRTDDSPKQAAGKNDEEIVLSLVEGITLGGGAFSRVSSVTEEGCNRAYALKRIRKTSVMRCPEHVYCEQAITRNLTHPFCIRQYGSFQDKYHLYFLFDLMNGGDLMDILVNDAAAVKVRTPTKPLRPACLAPQVQVLKGLSEEVVKFYIASIVLALEYLHENKVIYRDLKPENVLIDQQGYPKLGDFGFAKVLKRGKKTYTFCGTPGYVAPENVLAHGYGYSVDWWSLGVVTYVLLTGKQPFTYPRTDDQMEIMKRIVDHSYQISFPPYVSHVAKSFVLGLLERRPSRRLGCLPGRAEDIKRHAWFQDFDWDSLAARKMIPPRSSKDDAAKRIRELMNSERKGLSKVPKESVEDLREANRIFEDF